MEQPVIEEFVAGVATIIINRPEARNALSSGTRSRLREAIVRADADEQVRVVVISGAGSGAFCAGVDLKEAGADRESAEGRAVASLGPMRGIDRNLFETVFECGKPTIAALFGFTLGGGAELALACDLRCAARNLVFGFPEVEVGMGATFGSVLLPRLIPWGIAYEVLYSGRRLDVAECERWGLVNRVADDAEQAVRSAKELAGRLVELSPLTQRRYKAMIRAGNGLPVAAALRLNEVPNPYGSADQSEGIRAWRERRAPNWVGR